MKAFKFFALVVYAFCFSLMGHALISDLPAQRKWQYAAWGVSVLGAVLIVQFLLELRHRK
jgi:hypothetical protein